MCNAEQGLPAYAVCACGAKFYACDDGIIEAFQHIKPTSGPNHRWVYSIYNNPPVDRPRNIKHFKQHKYPWYYYENAEDILRACNRITRMSDLNSSSRDWYMRELYREAKLVP